MIAPCSPPFASNPCSFCLFFFFLSFALPLSLFLFNFLLSYAFRETLASTQIKASLADLPRCVLLTSFPPHFCRERKRCRRIRVGQRSVLLLRRGETTGRVMRKRRGRRYLKRFVSSSFSLPFEYAEFFNILAFFCEIFCNFFSKFRSLCHFNCEAFAHSSL